jgi:hypothetical protein
MKAAIGCAFKCALFWLAGGVIALAVSAVAAHDTLGGWHG